MLKDVNTKVSEVIHPLHLDPFYAESHTDNMWSGNGANCDHVFISALYVLVWFILV